VNSRSSRALAWTGGYPTLCRETTYTDQWYDAHNACSVTYMFHIFNDFNNIDKNNIVSKNSSNNNYYYHNYNNNNSSNRKQYTDLQILICDLVQWQLLLNRNVFSYHWKPNSKILVSKTLAVKHKGTKMLYKYMYMRVWRIHSVNCLRTIWISM